MKLKIASAVVGSANLWAGFQGAKTLAMFSGNATVLAGKPRMPVKSITPPDICELEPSGIVQYLELGPTFPGSGTWYYPETKSVLVQATVTDLFEFGLTLQLVSLAVVALIIAILVKKGRILLSTLLFEILVITSSIWVLAATGLSHLFLIAGVAILPGTAFPLILKGFVRNRKISS